MIGRNLNRRLEHLETHLLPAAGEPMVITMDFVDTNGTVVNRNDFTVAAISERTQSASATTAAMKNFDRRLARLEDRLGRTLSFETSTCRRTLSADGFLTEIVPLDGTPP